MIHHAATSDRLLRLVVRRFPDAVFHSPGPIWGVKRPARAVITLHDCIYRHFPNYSGRFFLRRILMQGAEWFAAGASMVLTDSEFSRRDLIARTCVPESKIEVLYPWVGSDFLRPISSDAVSALRTRLNLPRCFWLYLGGYDYRKNVDFLLKAYAFAARERSLPPLVLAGSVPKTATRSNCDVRGSIERLQLTRDQVILPGSIEAHDLPGLYRAASLLVYPSLMEGFGLPPAEANAVGTAVLSSHAGSLPEVVSNPNSLFDPRDEGALVEKLLAASDDCAQFVSPLSPRFTQGFAIARYLDLIRNFA